VRPEAHRLLRRDLLCRWPDASLTRAFRDFLAVYRTFCAASLASSDAEPTRAGYTLLCEVLRRASVDGGAAATEVRPYSPEEARVRALLRDLREGHRPDWLQRLASILAMLMHYAVDVRSRSLLVNRRRPRSPFPTYPMSPAAARLLAELVTSLLLEREFPAVCDRARAAESHAERALAFRILDPSFESGQLLLEVAQAILRRLHRRHPAGTRAARFLAQASLEKLFRDSLWGIDRNPLAIPAFRLLVSLLGAEHGFSGLEPRRLFAGDACDLLQGREFPSFDGVVNNPPWGEELAQRERDQLHDRFPSVQHRADTYVSFSELIVTALRPAGGFAILLPSQAITARNAAGLRELLLDQTRLERLILLPRAAFGDASVRGLVLSGRVRPVPVSPSCRITIYPLVKRLAGTDPPRSFQVPGKAFARVGTHSWSTLFAARDPVASWRSTIPLGSLAVVASGVQLHGVGRGDPKQTRAVVRRRRFSLSGPSLGATPAVRGRNLRPFHLLRPEVYVRFGSWLARIGQHGAYRLRNRIFVRELCRRDGRLTAAAARDGWIPLHGVLTVLPNRIDPRVLMGILNSGQAAEYVRAHAASMSKVDFQRITVGELQRMPIPAAALEASVREQLGLPPASPQAAALRGELIELVEGLSTSQHQGGETTAAFERLEAAVAGLFNGPQVCSE
jgi:N-6 DNA Methylase/TaqI-like C-terminal specificity domain